MQKSRKFIPSFLLFFIAAASILPNAAHAAEAAGSRSNLTIGILDSGIDASHPQLTAHVLQGYNTYNNSADTTDIVGHGTWVAGTALSTFNAYKSSAAPDATVAFVPVKITNETGIGYTGTAATALRRAADAGIKIVNLSFELHGGYPDINAAAREFVSRGGIVVAAAGNDAQYHAQPDNADILSVASVSAAGSPSRFSSSGPFVDLAAYGEQVPTTGLRGTSVHVSGTSFAAPQVAGVAALVWATNPSLTNIQVMDIVKKTARDTWSAGVDDKTGTGIVNPAAAIAAARASLPVATPQPTPEPSTVVAQAIPTAPIPIVLNDPSIPPMDPIFSPPQPKPAPAPVVRAKVSYKYVKRYVRKWNPKTKRYYWASYYVRVRA